MIVKKNKLILLLTVIGALLIIALPTIFKIYQGYESRSYEVAARIILESASDCYRDGVCTKEQMTIGDLKKTGYLKEDVINPRTKTYFDESLILVERNFEVSFFNS